jgi:hypothetical protein
MPLLPWIELYIQPELRSQLGQPGQVQVEWHERQQLES